MGLKKCLNLGFNPKANLDHLNSSLAGSRHAGICVGGQTEVKVNLA